ncbi:MAG: zinc-dependent alcohol dehydrogenase [Thermoleophilia bacterium]
MTETMRAAITDGAGGLVLTDRPAPTPLADGGLVRVLACGLCGSDLEKLDGGIRGGVVLGHEVVGVLERPDEEPVRVALAHHVPCGRCEACLRGHSSLCDQFVSTQLDPGGFAERLAVSPLHLADAVFRLPDAVDDLTGTLLEPLSCVLRAVDVAAAASTMFPSPRVRGVWAPAPGVADGPAMAAHQEVGPADSAGPAWPVGRAGSALVAGCGSVGLLFLSVLAVTQPASTLFYLERDAGRAALAEESGARAAGSDAMQVAFVTAPAALSEVVEFMAPGGVVVVFAAGAESAVPLDLGSVYRRELTLVGVRSGSPGHLRRALDLLVTGRLRLAWLRPDVVALEGLPQAVDRYRRGETLKVVVRP